MKIFLALLIAGAGISTARSQNLLANGDFSEINICKEYGMACGPKAWFSVPIGSEYFFRGSGYDGKNYVGYCAYDFANPAHRTFLETELLCPLVKDSMYVFEAMIYGDCIDKHKVSIYLPSWDYLYDSTDFTVIKPAASFADDMELTKTDKKHWRKLRLIFRAKGNEKYLVIGNFTAGPDGFSCMEDPDKAFYSLDVISLKPLDPGTAFCNDWQLTKAKLYNRRERHSLLEAEIKAARDSLSRIRISKTKITDTLVIPDILFATNSYQLSKKGNLLLDSLIQKINERSVDSIIVEGHTDSRGGITLNEPLSLNRAKTVAAYIQKGLENRIVPSYKGFASRRPVADNKTPGGRQKNRRVEIILYLHE